MKRTEESEDIGYQEHLPYRCGWQMQKAGKSTGQVIKVYLTRDKFWAHSLKGNPEIHFLSYFLYEEIFYVDTLSFSVLVRPQTHSFLLAKEQERPLLRTTGGLRQNGKLEGFCTGRGWLCSSVSTLLAHRYVAESPGSVGLIFRVDNDLLDISAENRSLGIPESSIGTWLLK